MQIADDVIKKIANDTGIDSIENLTKAALNSFLKDKKMKINLDILEMLNRYNIASAKELEGKIKKGEVSEHPAWEDMILLENLESSLSTIEDDIKALR